MQKYPKLIIAQNIRASKRICHKCNRDIYYEYKGRGHFYIKAVARGKYLCFQCEQEIDGEKSSRYINTMQ